MMKIQLDIQDIQIRESLEDMLKATETGMFKHRISNELKKKVYIGFDLLANWDFKYDKEKP